MGKVYASKESGGVEECFKLLKNSNFNINGTLNTIPIAPLTEVRRKYLFRNVRQHVDEEEMFIFLNFKYFKFNFIHYMYYV